MPTVQIIHLDAETLRHLAERDLPAARSTAPVPLTAYLVSDECVGTWRIRARQVVEDPTSVAWVTGVIVDEATGLVVGKAGFHGPPDDSGMVEVGYAVEPALRRRGYGRAALRALLDRARAEPSVRTVRASISPGNVPSERLVAGFGFAEIGQQWDEEDGLEIVSERSARP